MDLRFRRFLFGQLRCKGMEESQGVKRSQRSLSSQWVVVPNTHMLSGSWKEAPNSTVGLMERRETLRKQPEYSLKLKEESWCSLALKVTETGWKPGLCSYPLRT